MWSSKYCSLGLHLDSPAPEIKLFFSYCYCTTISEHVCVHLFMQGNLIEIPFSYWITTKQGGLLRVVPTFPKAQARKTWKDFFFLGLVVVDAHVWAQSNHLVLECKFLKLPFHMSKKKSLNVDSLTCLLVASHVSLRIIYCVLEEERKVVFSPQ